MDDVFCYNNGFWVWNIWEIIGCVKDIWIFFMFGFGGLLVVLMLNGMVYYYISDNVEFCWV